MEETKKKNENLFEAGKAFFEDYSQKMIQGENSYVTDNLQLKKDHSLKVAELSLYIAENLDMNKEDCKVAEIIGLLHDIGRFFQFQKYESFDDLKTVDHAALSLDIIQKEEFFKKFQDRDKQVILSAIGNHNKMAIIENDERCLKFCKILRDADKLSIWETCITYMKRDGSFSMPSISFDLHNKPILNDVVRKDIEMGKLVQKKDLKTVLDFKIFLLSMVYDINYKISFHYLNQKQLIKNIYETLPKRDEIIGIYRQIRLLIENKFVL